MAVKWRGTDARWHLYPEVLTRRDWRWFTAPRHLLITALMEQATEAKRWQGVWSDSKVVNPGNIEGGRHHRAKGLTTFHAELKEGPGDRSQLIYNLRAISASSAYAALSKYLPDFTSQSKAASSLVIPHHQVISFFSRIAASH